MVALPFWFTIAEPIGRGLSTPGDFRENRLHDDQSDGSED